MSSSAAGACRGRGAPFSDNSLPGTSTKVKSETRTSSVQSTIGLAPDSLGEISGRLHTMESREHRPDHRAAAPPSSWQQGGDGPSPSIALFLSHPHPESLLVRRSALAQEDLPASQPGRGLWVMICLSSNSRVIGGRPLTTLAHLQAPPVRLQTKNGPGLLVSWEPTAVPVGVGWSMPDSISHLQYGRDRRPREHRCHGSCSLQGGIKIIRRSGCLDK